MNLLPRPTLRVLGLLALLALVVGLAIWTRPRRSVRTPVSSPNPTLSSQQLAAAVTALETTENQVAETVWARDLVANQAGEVFERLWDAVNAASAKLELIAPFVFDQLILPTYSPPEELPHGIQRFLPDDAPGKPVGPGEWTARVQNYLAEGWELRQIEFRHHRFETDIGGEPAQSEFTFLAHLDNRRLDTRAALHGELGVDWRRGRDGDGLPVVGRLDASRLRLTTRVGPLPFRLVLDEVVRPPPRSFFIDPLILHDLNRDGLPEIILASANTMFRWDGRQFIQSTFCRNGLGLIFTGVIEDFDQDGVADCLTAGLDGLTLIRGHPGAEFAGPGTSVWTAPARLRYGQVLTCGDVDGDGDLDVWLGQYKNPYDGGQMPTPYYDANDGNPAYLLINDGSGRFTDATVERGLGVKRWRRSYSGSLVDLDGDGDLDLLVVSDFAGVELYANDGRGRFVEVTAGWLAEGKAFGMSHVLTDFNADGQIDFLVTGMHCPTASRLEGLGLSRPREGYDPAMRTRMTRGNLLRYGRAGGGFEVGSGAESIARSGWAWGSVAEDFDNDGYPDVAISNGHETRRLTREYEPEFWRHDIYVGGSREDPAVKAYFQGKFARTRGHGISYGGWEKNRFYLNRAGTEFLEVGYLFGLALEADSRNLAAADFDGDGRVDLALTTFEAWPEKRQTLKVYRNELHPTGDWVELVFPNEPEHPRAVGTRVTVRSGDRTWVRSVVTGDSHRSQQSGRMHWGLGRSEGRISIALRRPDGSRTDLEEVVPNRRYSVPVP